MTMSTKPRLMRGIGVVRADAGGDPKAIFAELKSTFETFKAEHTAQLADVKRGLDDVVRAEKVDKINARIGDLQDALDKAVADVDAMKVNGGTAPGGLKDPEYSDAFRAHFRRGEVRAALNKGASDEGGFLAPVEWDRTITDKLVEVSPMRQIATVQPISGAGFKKLYNLRGTASGWVGEAAARTATDTATFGEMTFTPGELYANPAATQQMLDDSEVSLENWLAMEVETEFAYQEGLAFISGDGTNKPKGFLTFVTGGTQAATNPLGAIELKTAAGATAITTDELVDMVYLLPSVFTGAARFVMNRSTQGYVRKLKDGDGNYIWQPSYVAGQPATLLGYPVTEMPGMPDIATGTLPIGFGDFRRGYRIIDRTGVRVLRDPFTNKPYVHFYTTKRVGGGVDNPECLKVLKMG